MNIRLLSIAFILLITFTASCSEDAPTPTPLPGNAYNANGFRLTLVNSLKGPSAIQDWLATSKVEHGPVPGSGEGWQLIGIHLAVESSETVARYLPHLCGQIVDSGNYTRDLDAFGFYGPFQVAPQVRYDALRVYAAVPINQNPVKLILYPVGLNNFGMYDCGNRLGSDWNIDLTMPPATLSFPYDQPPSLAPTSNDGSLRFEIPNKYKITISNLQFGRNEFWENHFTMSANITIENLGGYNLNYKEIDAPRLLVIHQSGSVYTSVPLGGNSIFPPGVPKTFPQSIFTSLQNDLFADSSFYILLVDEHGTPQMQTTIIYPTGMKW